jgi:hypothetical protein
MSARELVDDLDPDQRRVHIHHDHALAAPEDALPLQRDVERAVHREAQ